MARLATRHPSTCKNAGIVTTNIGSQKHNTDQLVRVVAHDLSVLAGSWLALVGVDDEVLGPAVVRLVHEAPLHTGGEAGTAAAAETYGG